MKRLVTSIVLMSFAASAWALEQGAAPPGPTTPAAAAPVPSAPAATAGNEPSALQPAVQTSPSAAAAAQDRIELDTTQITGNRELPRVLYVVPWKRPDLGDPDGRPANSLLDEVLAPVDRDVFRRQNRYYQALKPDAAGPGKGNSTEGEK